MPLIDTSKTAREALLRELSSQGPEPERAIDKYDNSIGITFKKKIVIIVVCIFLVSVVSLWFGLWWVGSQEYALLRDKIILPGDRIITERLLLALIAGTVTQVSISFGLMMKYLFSKGRTDTSSDSQSSTLD
jgi:hypothetical protein